MRLLALLLIALGLGISAWRTVAGARAVVADVPTEVGEATIADRSAALARARKACRLEVLDAFVKEQRALVDGDPEDGAAWAVLAESLLERIYTRDVALGLRPGEPTHEELPAVLVEDAQAGLAACDRALELGEDSPDLWCTRMGLLSAQVNGVAAALALHEDIDAALTRAIELDATNPRVQVAVGLRKVFAPKLLGQDLEAGRDHLLLAAEALPEDERPLLYAGLAEHLLGDDEAALALVDRALERTPAHPIAQAARERLAAGEDEPFARDAGE